MKKYISILMSFIVVSFVFAETKKSTVITYPAPASEKVFTKYFVFVNGKPVDLYKASSPMFFGGEYYFCYFDFEGEIDVKVKSANGFCKKLNYTNINPKDLEKAAKTLTSEVYPTSNLLKVERTPTEVNIKANKPFQTIVMRSGIDMPLLIFGNPLEKNPPKKGDKDVIYFDAGVHCPDGKIELKDNQTLYIAGGAVVKAPVVAKGKNIKVMGRGIISTERYQRETVTCFSFTACENLKIEGVIIKDPSWWTFIISNSFNVKVNNIKICGSRILNDDAIDIVNSVNVSIKNSFARAQDDIIAIKGMGGKNPVENIYIENCILWTDCANIFRIGYESEAPYFKNIKCKNIYVPFYAEYRKPTETWSHAIVWVQPSNGLLIENVEIDGLHIRSNGKDMPLLIANPRKSYYAKTFGRADGCKIKNVFVTGKKGKFRGEVWIAGRSPEHTIKNVSVENAVYFGKKKTADDKDVFVGEYTENINIFKK